MPQLRRDGIEKSGTSTPAWRPACEAARRDQASARSMHRRTPSANARGLGQQAHDQERFVGEIEEESRVHQHAVALEQIEHQILFAARRRDAQDGGPAGLDRQDLNRGMRRARAAASAA